MRRWGFASITCVAVAASVAPASAQDVSAGVMTADTAGGTADPAVGYGALPGGIHVSSAENLPKGVAEVEMLAGYGSRSGLLAADHTLGRALGDVSVAYSPLEILTLGLSFDGRYDHHTGGPAPTPETGYVGDPHLYVRVAKELGKIHLGGQLGIWTPGRKAPSLVASATSLDFRALLSVPVGPGLLSINAGYQLDNSINSADSPSISMLSLEDRVSLGVSDYDEVYAGAMLAFRAGPKAWIGVEGSFEAFIGTAKTHPNDTIGPAPLDEGSVIARGAVMGGYRINDMFSAIAYVELAKVPGIEYSQVAMNAIPIIPYEPVVTGGIGIQARFGATKRRACPAGTELVGGQCQPIVKPCEERGPDACPRVPIMTDLGGTVVDEDGKPIAGAKVTIKLAKTEVPPVVTDQTGAYKARIRIGDTIKHTQPKPDEDSIDETTATVTVEVDKKKPSTKTVSPLKKDGNVVETARLESIQSGQLKVIATRSGGKPLAGVSVAVGDRKAVTDSDGVAVIELAPGSYKVTLKATGFKTQELDFTIEPPNGLTVKQAEMQK